MECFYLTKRDGENVFEATTKEYMDEKTNKVSVFKIQHDDEPIILIYYDKGDVRLLNEMMCLYSSTHCAVN